MGEARRKKLATKRYVFRANCVLVIEWLDAIHERKTGQELASFLRQRGINVTYVACLTGNDVITAITNAADELWLSKNIPILHIEAHGHPEGLAPGENSNQFLEWKQIEGPMRRLNIMSGFNLILVCAACYSFHSIRVFRIDDVSPFTVAFGFNAKVGSTSLFDAMRELYRQFFGQSHPTLNVASENANRELRASDELLVATDCRRVGRIIVEGAFDDIFDPIKRAKRLTAIQGKLTDDRKNLPIDELDKLLVEHAKAFCQRALSIWYAHEMFPENKERFNFDVDAMFDEARQKRALLTNS